MTIGWPTMGAGGPLLTEVSHGFRRMMQQQNISLPVSSAWWEFTELGYLFYEVSRFLGPRSGLVTMTSSFIGKTGKGRRWKRKTNKRVPVSRRWPVRVPPSLTGHDTQIASDDFTISSYRTQPNPGPPPTAHLRTPRPRCCPSQNLL